MSLTFFKARVCCACHWPWRVFTFGELAHPRIAQPNGYGSKKGHPKTPVRKRKNRPKPVVPKGLLFDPQPNRKFDCVKGMLSMSIAP